MKCKYNVRFLNRVDDIWSVLILTMIKLPRQLFLKNNIDFLIKMTLKGPFPLNFDRVCSRSLSLMYEL